MKKISSIFALLAMLLTNVMIAVVAFNYGAIKIGIKYGGYSAPTSCVLLYAIPFLVGIIACIVVALFFKKKGK